MDRVLLACDRHNFADCLALAREHQAGLEVQTFAQPQVLDGDWREVLDDYKVRLAGFGGERACHGAFYDLACGSPDRLVRGVARQRYLQNLEIAGELGARTVVFHVNFLPQVTSPSYRDDWSEMQAAFWGDLVRRAEALDVTIALENMWEPVPALVAGILDRVGSAHLRACVDVGHVHLYSRRPLADWLAALGARVVCVHLNNTAGTDDDHLGLGDGVIDYARVLPALRALRPCPAFVLEIDRVAALEQSLHYFDLPQSQPAPGARG